jgi:VCBS repeat-containing protein
LVTAPGHGTLSLGTDGSFAYQPQANFNGTDGFTYKADNGVSQSGVATVSITVTAVNDPPVAVNDVYSAGEDTPLMVAAPGVLGNDSDVDGPSLSAILVSPAASGTVTLNANGSFSYSPNLNFTGTDSFTYQATDGIAESAVATVTISVTPKPTSYQTNQYASTVLGWSSTYAQWWWNRGYTNIRDYTAEKALGAPNVFAYGDNRQAWAPFPLDGTLEYLALGFATPVYADSVTVRETLGNGFVYQIDVLDTAGTWTTVWTGTDPTHKVTYADEVNKTTNAVPVDALFTFPETPYLVTGVTVRVKTSTTASRREEIDAVTLHGRVNPP